MTRGDVVVVVPVYGARELFEECLRSVVEHTTPGTRVLVADDASPDPDIRAFTDRLVDGAPVDLGYVRRPENLGFVGNMNAAFRDDGARRRGDRELRHRRPRRLAGAPARGRLQRRPRRHRDQPDQPRLSSFPCPTATSPCATCRGGPVRRRGRAAGGGGLAPAPARGFRPASDTACWVRRAVLDLIGEVRRDVRPGVRGGGRLLPALQSPTGSGHIAADDLSFHHGGASFGATGPTYARRRDEDLVRARYPWFVRHGCRRGPNSTLVAPPWRPPARRSLLGLTVGGRRAVPRPDSYRDHGEHDRNDPCPGPRPEIDRLVAFGCGSRPRGWSRGLQAELPRGGLRRDPDDQPKIPEGGVVDVMYRPYQVQEGARAGLPAPGRGGKPSWSISWTRSRSRTPPTSPTTRSGAAIAS